MTELRTSTRIGVCVLALVISAGMYASTRLEQKNVVIFAFDGLQAQHLHAYRYEKKTTPYLDTFLAESTVFTRTVSPASWTVPAFMSMFTSLYPSEHRLTNKLVEVATATTTRLAPVNLKRMSPSAMTLAEILKRHGYRTAAFTGDAGVTGAFGFNQGFDEYYDATTFGGLDTSIPKAKDWLAAHKDEKFFLFVHGYDVHGQFAPKDGFDYRYVEKPYTGVYTGSPTEQRDLRERGLSGGDLHMSEQDTAFWRAIYDEKINDADKEFGQFMIDLKELGLTDNTIVIVVSDHGTEFFEHGRMDHGHTLYGELVNTLFAIHVPGQSGRVVSSLVSTLDLVPTLLPLLNVSDDAERDMRGVNVLTKNPAHDVYSETDYRLYTHKRSVTTTDGWKFILTRETGEKELYNLHADFSEQRNVVGDEPQRAYELEQKLLAHLKEVGDTGPWRVGCLAVYADQCK